MKKLHSVNSTTRRIYTDNNERRTTQIRKHQSRTDGYKQYLKMF